MVVALSGAKEKYCEYAQYIGKYLIGVHTDAFEHFSHPALDEKLAEQERGKSRREWERGV